MFAARSSGDYEPITWWGRVPVYASTILVMVHCATMIFFALLGPTSLSWLYGAVVFTSPEVLAGGQVWRIFTYAFAHNIGQDGLFFLLEMAMLYWFGQQVERYLGRRHFLILYGTLLISAPVFLSLAALVGVPSALAGSSLLTFAIFLSFAAIYPSAEIFFGIQSRWIAAALLAIYSLISISRGDWVQLATLWQQAGTALLILRALGVYSLQQVWPGFRMPRLPHRQAKFRVLPKPEPEPEVDVILDKIARQGISSLNAAERRVLEKERETLLEKERRP